MFAYVIKHFSISIVVLFFATILGFLSGQHHQGDPLALLRANPHTPHSTIVAREHLLHLNDPLWQACWMGLQRNSGQPRRHDQGSARRPAVWSHSS